MTSDGKHLEELVAFVERTLLPQGFEVKTNERVFDDAGKQVAEFDVEVRGKVGSTAIAWLIECRDRPSAGSGPTSWIEQLVGRRTRFGFNKVTAVSTTGFTADAIEFAKKEGIELREVKALTPEDFANWLPIRHMHHQERVAALGQATLLIDESESPERREALLAVISHPDNVPFLKSSTTGQYVQPSTAFLIAATQGASAVSDRLEPNGPGEKVRLHTEFADHFVVETPLGDIRVRAILFEGELRLKETLVPLATTAEYRHTSSGTAISQVASFAPQQIYGTSMALELHRVAESGETHVILRKLPDEPKAT